MRVLLQRVKEASVTVDGRLTGQCGPGLLLLVGVTHGDSEAEAAFLAEKCARLRIFSDEAGKMNLSAVEAAPRALVISQFTLYGDTRKGRRPAFTDSAEPGRAEELYTFFIKELQGYLDKVESGIFGADMQVALVNDGPVTLMLEK